MRVEEIILRQEIRQILSEAGLDKNTLHEMAKSVLQEEIAKQVKNAINQSNITTMAKSSIRSYELKELLKDAIKQEVSSAIKLSIDVRVEDKENTYA